MRSFVLIGLIGVLLASTSIAQAHNTNWAWTESKASKMVAGDATVRLPAAQRATLEAELLQSVRLYSGLLLATSHQENGDVEVVYQLLLNRYRMALNQVRNGIEVDTAACKGSGRAVSGSGRAAQINRFKHFRCSVVSGLIEIPVTALASDDRELPLVIEGPPRVIGPVEASLDVHVAGKASIAYRQVAR
jgi:hypothetical protein